MASDAKLSKASSCYDIKGVFRSETHAQFWKVFGRGFTNATRDRTAIHLFVSMIPSVHGYPAQDMHMQRNLFLGYEAFS